MDEIETQPRHSHIAIRIVLDLTNDGACSMAVSLCSELVSELGERNPALFYKLVSQITMLILEAPPYELAHFESKSVVHVDQAILFMISSRVLTAVKTELRLVCSKPPKFEPLPIDNRVMWAEQSHRFCLVGANR
ncbi:hypothetical protein INS49_003591 [Diaporthe citri]|uniref:uncharacterized protein n=1 Tax=Diaporthe citri TaxID=83186 RepID=UPI001C81A69C|nr:uncharacterized protein INS49_003591 [Diaporthe citri]KAG6355629.1 hypothetical protein INS49_003591 [Diaporthe citri]